MLSSWASSPTRLREDAAAELDLVKAGYRDRLLTEMAQNAADAAAKSGAAGELAVWAGPDSVHFANTGAPLDAAGVQALSALRASDKSGAVGRFGVGFSAVAAVAVKAAIWSRDGSVRFSLADTAAEIASHAIDVAVSPPLLRLVWPDSGTPAPGFATEVVLTLRPDVSGRALLTEMKAGAAELLLELPSLSSITVGDSEYHRETITLNNEITEVLVGEHVWWQYQAPHARWLLPVRQGDVVAASPDVLRAPTRSDEELSLPAILIADIAMQPDRRRVLPGAGIDILATGYEAFAAALPPGKRLLAVPAAGMPRSAVDEQLRAALLQRLRTGTWLPSCAGPDLIPGRAQVLTGLTAGLAAVLTNVISGLVIPELSDPRAVPVLVRAGATPLGLAELAQQLSGIARPVSWWHELYAALDPLVSDPAALAELGALPVPLSDGRLVTGPRTTLIAPALDLAAHDDAPDHALQVPWARLVHPAAAHPLLERLGARVVSARELLCDPVLRDQLESGQTGLTEPVLSLAAHLDDGEVLPEWLGLLELPDEDATLRPADELLLPGAPLAAVLDTGVAQAATALVTRYGASALRAVGVGWGFGLLREDWPTGPDHGLANEREWWESLSGEPAELSAVLDLDLVADDKWELALDLLAQDPATARQLVDPDGYTAWWLRRYAQLGGVPLGSLRPADDLAFAGLLDPCQHPAAAQLGAVLASPARVDAALAQELADALADPAKAPALAVIVATHRLLAQIGADVIDPPPALRAIDGSVISPESALVLDQPWLAAVLPPAQIVLGDIPNARQLAEVLGVALASERVASEVVSTGRRAHWETEPVAALARLTLSLPEPHGDLMIHDGLRVRVTGAVQLTKPVNWWIDAAGCTHLNSG